MTLDILETKTSEQKDHAEYSASGSARWLNCPGSLEQSKRYPALPDNKYSIEGTNAHACLEFLLNNRDNLKAALTDPVIKQYSREMVEHALEAIAYVVQRQKDLPGSEIICETKVDSSPFLGVPDQFGTLDIAIVQPFGLLEVIDYKFGAQVVEPREDDGQLNSQMAYYGLGASYVHDHNFQSVRITIIQPRAWHESGETIRSADASMEELLGWADRFRRGVRLTKEPDLAFLQAGKWCKYCPASIDCPEVKDKSFKSAQIAFSDEKGITVLPEIQTPAIQMNLGTILTACDRLEEWTKKVRAFAIETLAKGGKVEGYKLVQKRSTRKWRDETATMQEALDVWGPESHVDPKLKSPAQMEATFGKEAKDWVKERVTDRSTGTTLAKESDKRPAVNFESGLTAIDIDLGFD